MITIHETHSCKMCKIEIQSWMYPHKQKFDVYLHSYFPVDNPVNLATYECKACKYSGQGNLVLIDLPDVKNVLMDVKEI